jgi:carboxylesterase type B
MRFSPLVAVVLLLSFRTNAITMHKKATAPTSTTRNGTYFGIHVPQLSQDIFRGIPFARAPRFQLPQSLNETSESSCPAVEPGATCVGFGINNWFGWPVGEDCLNLNVVRPEGIDCDAKLPVLVWIYGGDFAEGPNRDPEFNTSFLVQTSIEIGHPVIVVSINYRLNSFGFLASYEVQAGGVTNLGLRDQ